MIVKTRVCDQQKNTCKKCKDQSNLVGKLVGEEMIISEE